MYAGRKDCRTNFELRKDAFQGGRIQENVYTLRNVGCVHRIMERVILDVVILKGRDKREKNFWWYHQGAK